MIHRNSRKRTRSLPFSPWVKGLILGFSLGAGLQFIPGTEGLFSLFEASPPPTFTTISHQDSKKSIPLSHPILEREGYTVAYDGRTKSPLWVFEELTKESLNGDVDRSQFQFVQDPDIPEILQGDVLDYKGQGFDCGHIAPAADHRSTENGMKETFYLSNISPQTPQFNRGYWKHFEKYVRDLTKEYERVEVVGGPLFLPHAEKGKRFVKYQVIGNNDVAVPTHFFKVIKATNGRLKRQWAYILPNQEIDEKVPLDKFKVSIEKIEKASGIIFQ